jgi:hypothetical protein
MLKEERNHIVIKAQPYTLQDGSILYKVGLDGILHHCLTTFKAYQVLSKMQKDLLKDVMAFTFTMKKILIVNYL